MKITREQFELVWELNYKSRCKVARPLCDALDEIVFGVFPANSRAFFLLAEANRHISINMQSDPDQRAPKAIQAVEELARSGVTRKRYLKAVKLVQEFCRGIKPQDVAIDWVNYLQYKEV